MQIADTITELKLGNGTSVLIFANIASALPTSVGAALTQAASKDSANVAIYAGAFFLTTLGIVYVQEAERKIPMNYAGRYRNTALSRQSYLPFKVCCRAVLCHAVPCCAKPGRAMPMLCIVMPPTPSPVVLSICIALTSLCCDISLSRQCQRQDNAGASVVATPAFLAGHLLNLWIVEPNKCPAKTTGVAAKLAPAQSSTLVLTDAMIPNCFGLKILHLTTTTITHGMVSSHHHD